MAVSNHQAQHGRTSILVALLLVCALPVCGAPEKDDMPLPALVLPFFQVDTLNPAGKTTLFAVRNSGASAVDVDITYYATDGTILRSDSLTLDAGATYTVNVRDVPGLPADPDGVARGFAIITATSGRLRRLTGDFFQVDVAESFATGERLISPELCPNQEIRFADFGAGTELVLLLAMPQVPTRPRIRRRSSSRRSMKRG